jgi:PAS domain S-box-containing protein
LATLGTYLIVGLISLSFHDWKTVWSICGGSVALILPYWLLRSGRVRIGNLILTIIVLASVTTIATVGQGIHDLAIVAYPIIFIYVGLTSDRVMLGICGGITFVALLWLAFGESFGWFTTVPLFRDPLNLFYLSVLTVLLVVTALAVDLLSSNLRKTIEVAHQEIDARRQAEQALKDSNELFSQFLLHSPIYAYIKEVSPSKSRVLHASENFKDMIGIRGSEMIGKSMEELFPPEFAAKMTADDWAVVSSGSMLELAEDLTGRNYTTLKFPISQQGKKYLAGFTIDITERTRAEEALRQSEEKFRQLTEKSLVGIYIIQDARIVYVNPSLAKMFGYAPEEIVGSLTLKDFIHPDDVQAVLARLQEQLDGKTETGSIRYKALRRDHSLMYIEVYGMPVKYEDRPAVMGTLLNVTERIQAEEALRQAQKMETIGQLAGGVAHDFNNMLQVISSYVEMSLTKARAGQPLHKYLLEIRRAAQRSAEITSQLLAFARKQTVSPKVLDLSDAVARSQKMVQRLVGEDIELAWLPGFELWPVMIDPTQLDQIVANLAANARDAIGGVGRLTIETEKFTCDEEFCAAHADSRVGDYVLLSVSDDGQGMGKETMSHLFEPFFTTKGPGKGTGLGLATIYGIVKQNNGFIDVFSTPGHGTTFKVYLPRAGGTTAAEQLPGQAAPRAGTETVLFVDDEAAILEMAKDSLEQLGYTVLTASSPEEAIRRSETWVGSIHLLITDVVMPQMNGRQLSERVIAMRPALKCLYMSGYTADVIANRGILEEGVNFIAKPFSLTGLCEKVRKVLDG